VAEPAIAGLDLEAVREAMLEKGDVDEKVHGAILDAHLSLVPPAIREEYDALIAETLGKGVSPEDAVKAFPPPYGSWSWGPGSAWTESFVKGAAEVWEELQAGLVESALRRTVPPTGTRH
jgi:hypothetical protein